MLTVTQKKRTYNRRRQLKGWLVGYLFILPVLLGILIFTLYPMAMSLYYSFTRYDVLSDPQWIGWKNYQELLHDPLFWTSLGVTLRYVLISVPLNLVLSGLLSILLNQKLKGIFVYRAIVYIPVVIPLVVMGMLFRDLYDVQNGLIDGLLRAIGLPPYPWLSSPDTALNSLIVMNLWQIGAGTIIWLAGLRSIPQYLYDATKVDGANVLRRFWHVTIPMLTPIIFFNLILGVIQSLQTFTQAYVTTTNGTVVGGPINSTLFIVLNIFQQAFYNFRMGYASAIAWVLFIIIALLAAVIFRTSSWVYYEGGEQHP